MDKKEILRELLEDLDELTDEEFLQLVEILEKSSVPQRKIRSTLQKKLSAQLWHTSRRCDIFSVEVKSMIVKTLYRVKFFDTDTFGIVHHSNYIRWFETGRVEFLRELGIDLNEMMDDGILFPIIEIGANFHAPAKFDDELEIETAAEALTKAKMKFNYVIRKRGEEKILVEGTSTNVFTSSGKICRLPEKFSTRLAKGLS